jgi:hypothetical protein
MSCRSARFTGMSRLDTAGTSRISNVLVRSRAPLSVLILIKRNLTNSEIAPTRSRPGARKIRTFGFELPNALSLKDILMKTSKNASDGIFEQFFTGSSVVSHQLKIVLVFFSHLSAVVFCDLFCSRSLCWGRGRGKQNQLNGVKT